jgi:hypothetical protein
MPAEEAGMRLGEGVGEGRAREGERERRAKGEEVSREQEIQHRGIGQWE